MGMDLKKGLGTLMNGIKSNVYFPEEMIKANISSIYKSKGSKLGLSNDRGIFFLGVVRKIWDKLIYQEFKHLFKKEKKHKRSSFYVVWNH